MLIVILLLLIVYGANANVDYWGIKQDKSPFSIKVKKKKKDVSKEEKQGDILELSKKWYENKIKKERAPIEYYYFKNPQKYKKQYYAWLQWKRKKEEQLLRNYLAEAKAHLFNLTDAIRFLKKRGYVILYFYKPDCPYCKAEKPEIQYLSNYFEIYTVNIYEKPYEALKWRIKATPTIIAVSPKEKKAFRVEGYIDAFSLIKYFYEKAKAEDKR